MLALATGLTLPAAAQQPEYRIGPKDVLRIMVWGHEDLTRSAVVSADGTFPFPLIGDVRAAGLTPSQLEATLRELLGKDYLVEPQVSVRVEEYRSQRVFVLGEAEKPGTYILTGGTATLLDILSQAGGPSRGAGRQAVVVRFPKSDRPMAAGVAGSTTLRVDLQKLLAGDVAENLVLQNGDTIYIPKLAAFLVLAGEVRKPGVYQLELPTTAFGAIALAGGFTERAGRAETKLISRLPSGEEQVVILDLSGDDSRARDWVLKDGDMLLVPAGNSVSTLFYVLGQVQKPGGYQLDGSTTAIQGIALAGGFTDKAAPNRTKVIRTHKDGRQETFQVDLNEVVKRGRKDKDVPLMANDVIIVPESFF